MLLVCIVLGQFNLMEVREVSSKPKLPAGVFRTTRKSQSLALNDFSRTVALQGWSKNGQNLVTNRRHSRELPLSSFPESLPLEGWTWDATDVASLVWAGW